MKLSKEERMRLILWAAIIAGLVVLLSCQSAEVKTPENIQGDGNEIEVDQRQQSNSTVALIVIPLGCVVLFLTYLYFSKNFIGFGRKPCA